MPRCPARLGNRAYRVWRALGLPNEILKLHTVCAEYNTNYGKTYNYLYTRRLARFGNLASGVAGFRFY